MIVSTTLTGSSAPIIAAALASVVDHVDQCIVLDTGIRDETLAVARNVVGEKLRVFKFPWINDFSAARNFALWTAELVGADWAITVDTDERLIFAPGFDLRAQLTATTPPVVLCQTHDRRYMKERILRLNVGISWIGLTHECVDRQPTDDNYLVMPELTFEELPKSEETKRHNFERDIPLLNQFMAEHPEDPRWPLFLGLSYYNHGLYAECIDPFERSGKLSGWEREGVTACLRMIKALGMLGRWGEAVALCERVVAARPEAQEFLFYLDVTRSKAAKFRASSPAP